MVVLSPPGITSPSTSCEFFGGADAYCFRTSESSAFMGLEIALQCENSDSFLRPMLPAPGLHQFRFGELRDIESRHRHAQIFAGFE